MSKEIIQIKGTGKNTEARESGSKEAENRETNEDQNIDELSLHGITQALSDNADAGDIDLLKIVNYRYENSYLQLLYEI